MADFRAWFRGSRKIWFVGVIIAVALLWAIEQPFFLAHPSLQLLFRELSFAMLIASIFGLTLEQIQRSEFIKLVTEERKVLKKDVFLYAYGSNLPEQIRSQIQETILTQTFSRYDLLMDWEFHEVAGKPELLHVKKRYSYVVVNQGNDKKNWPFSFVQIGADEQKAIATSTFGVLRIRRGDEYEEYKEGRLKTEEPPDQPHTKRFSVDIEIPAHESIGVYYEILQVRKMYGEDKYNSKEPLSGTTKVKLHFPFDFDVTVVCKTKSLAIAPDNEPYRRYSYEWKEGMLPYQGISVSWSRRSEVKQGKEK